jgi:hypothetical protein
LGECAEADGVGLQVELPFRKSEREKMWKDDKKTHQGIPVSVSGSVLRNVVNSATLNVEDCKPDLCVTQ